jgi:hypothetical protein
MKAFTSILRFSLTFAAALPPLVGHATVITTDTTIGVADLTYDGQDIVVSNAVLTVDGPHAFNSLRLAEGAMLTHTAASNGTIFPTFTFSVTNEPHVLTATNPVSLEKFYVLQASVLVRDTNNLITYSNGVDYVLTEYAGGTTLQLTTNSSIPDGDTVLVSYDYSTTLFSDLILTLASDFEIEPGASLNVDGRGFGGALGPGSGGTSGSPASGGGAGHGGFGGLSSSNSAGGTADKAPGSYGLGSGGGTGTGGSGGPGGGAVVLNIRGNCILNGTVTANGANATNSRSGGGSGGSIWITAPTISGTGTLSVRGGAGEPVHGGGGGGGHIVLHFQTNLFTGAILTHGGAGWQRGGAGTLYLRTNNSNTPIVIVDNGGFSGAATLFDFSSPTTAAALEVRGRAAAVTASGTLQLISGLVVRSNSTLTTSATNNAQLTLQITGDAVIESGATLLLDGKGYPPNQGPGVGVPGQVGSGAGHGGYGGNGVTPTTATAGGNYYGSIPSPSLAGSGGRTYSLFPGGSGGGAVRMTVTGNLRLDGKISTDGTAGGGSMGGGASGGSVWLSPGSFSGNGSISANGGSGGLPYGGGGAGGRIAITYATNAFTGHLTAAGGAGAVGGGAGTIYTKLNSSTYVDFRADNGGINGTNTVLDASASYNLTVTGGATLRSTLTQLAFGTLTVGSNSTLLLGNGSSSVFVTVASNANVAAGGGISGDGLGYASGAGTGAGQFSSIGSTGGGHGGYGGRGLGFTNLAVNAGGSVYDSTATPTILGSGGGGVTRTGSEGGAALRMTFSGPLLLNGRISVNGASTSTNNNGGGAGGALWLTFNDQFSGTGLISADGGTGHLPNGGGGGGGRIALYYGSNSFTGTYSAKGGSGFNPGGAGTVYLKANSNPYPNLIVDNGGLSGTNALTLLDLSILSNLTIRSGGSLTSSVSSVSVSNLNIGANASLRVRTMTLNVSGAATIAAGGGILADGVNSEQSSGNGLSSPAGSSGGGHGGYGGRGVGALGGNVTDSTTSPTLGGGYGGNYSSGQVLGGGALRMSVTGPMILDGKLSANGNSPTNGNGGGGAGGGVWLTLNQFSGAGSISANGGAAQASGTGGGGGGGRVAIYYNSNSFAGTLSAKGGNGFQAGGAGTIYLKDNRSQLPNLIVDNGGLSGTNTVLDVSSLSNLTITGGAILKPSSVAQTLNVTTLNIGTNSSLLTAQTDTRLTLNISGGANIAAGGSISGDGLGSAGGNGNGLGQTATGGSGGAGHAGYGGRGLGNAPAGGNGAGGNAYGSLTSPNLSGSGGGGISASGGSGGSVIIINATRSLLPFILDGRISASGFNAFSNNAGGGSGGSVWLSLNQLLGAGSITADGGSGHLPNGGGGGGGRIAVSYAFVPDGKQSSTNGFTGTFSAKGGNGFVRGGAGTVYLRTNNASTAFVLVDNGGARGTNTLVSGSGTFDLFVQGGAVATSIGSPRDLFVRSNSFVRPAGDGGFTITRNATFETGGGINLDGASALKSAGDGSTSSNPRGGAGHGGYGALNPAFFGGTYDSALLPSLFGSAGGNGSGSTFAPFGGLGGGAVRLTVGNTLALNGEISADGLDGDLNSGGGSGGAVWLQTMTLSGSGQITATGGNGNGTAGGGGGGRIAIYATTNLFTGTISACGGNGAVAGGAGTIYLRDNLLITSLLLDNCGLVGTNTPLASSIGLATNLTVTGGAVGEFQGAIPAFSNLVVGAGGWVTARRTDTNLYLALLGNLTVADSGGVVVDAKGFARATGTGAGGTLNNQGAGGSYGGWGGDSASGAFSGPDYGSATMPVDRGSGGGAGAGPATGGSEGGGAIHLAVAGALVLDGLMSAGGGLGWQDDSGGGSGGSVWISAKKFTGHGALAATGGDGDLYGGGGGGGGRIAVYSPMNTFTGLMSVAGGDGAYAGEAGTIFAAGSFPGLEVVSQTPTGLVADAVSAVTLEFSEAVNPLSVSASDFKIYTPYGSLASSNLSWSLPGPATLRISFPPQNVPGNYRLEVGPLIEGFLAPRMSQVYTGAFTAVLPLLSGNVTDTNGQPVAGVLLQPSGGLMPVTTAANGHYSLGVPLGWNGSVTPAVDNFLFAPGSRSYAGVSADATNQNYLMVASLAASLQAGKSGPNLFLNWNGFAGVTYQVYWSTNLNDTTWYPLDAPVAGTNGVMQLLIPISDEPEKYFRLNAQN